MYSITGLAGADPAAPFPSEVTVRAEQDGQNTEFIATVRIDTPAEAAYYRHGGILQYVLRQTARKRSLREPAAALQHDQARLLRRRDPRKDGVRKGVCGLKVAVQGRDHRRGDGGDPRIASGGHRDLDSQSRQLPQGIPRWLPGRRHHPPAIGE